MRRTTYLLAILAIFLTSCNLPVANLPVVAPSTQVQISPTPFQPSRQAALGFFRNLPASTNLPQTNAQNDTPLVMPTLQPLGSPTPSASVDMLTPTDLPGGLPTATAQPLPTVQINMDDPTILNLPDTVTFLLLGSDTRGGASFRTDTILIVILRPKDGNVSIISVPRDLWVNIPMVGEQRINVAYQYGDIYDYPGGGAGI